MKYVLVTGASRGIGAAAALEFARQGYGVAVHYHRREEDARRVAAEAEACGVPVLTVQADVADGEQVRRMAERVLGAFGQLDALVCNAGISHTGLFQDVDARTWRRVFAVNVDGVYHCCQAFLPHFIRRKAGSIVTVSSMWGQVGASCEVAYSAAKGAVIAFTKALAKELAPSGIRVNCVAPGAIDTEMNARLSAAELSALAEEIPLGRLGEPEEAARAIVFLAGGAASYLTGQILAPNGGMVV